MVKYNWILFDADNTIFDFHGSSEIAFHKSFSWYGIDSDDEDYQAFKKINLETWAAFDENRLDHQQIKEYRFRELFKRMDIGHLDPLEFNGTYFEKLVQNIRYVEGAREILSFLEGKVRMAIITNGMKEVQRPRLEASEIYHYFDLIVVSGEIGHSKPNPSFFQYVYNHFDQIRKEKILVVGDNLYADVKGGNDFGFETVWYNPNQLPIQNGIHPDYEIGKLAELKELIVLHPD